MQKKLKIVKIGKPGAAFSGILVLFLLILSAQSVDFAASASPAPYQTYEKTLYQQLDGAVPSQIVAGTDTSKMNNCFFKNANDSDSPGELPIIETLRVYDADAGTVREMPLEDYVLCALIAEMPQSFAPQALMAQAVACRTFAVRGACGASKHADADVCTDYRCCQSFRDAESAGFDIQKAREAVQATKGIIAVYDGQPILAAYHAASVGSTRSSAEVWGGEVSYLCAVAAPEPKEAAAQTVTLTDAAVRKAFAKMGLDGEPLFLTEADGLCSGVSDAKKKKTLTARQVQNALSLRSDSFDVRKDGENYVFTSYGYGHGVGMSQYGADALASQGYDFYEILKYYYTGISFAFVS